MSWQTLNRVVGLAMVDATFAQRLLANPLSVIQESGFELTQEEQDVLRQVKANDISELCQILIERFAEETPSDFPPFTQRGKKDSPESNS
ncbi:MAG TPA: Os1348 family NHLP clan protein [Ktedonobacteraceae bacterium]|nr:Os1348 family NHLP clan protein [Ktedonobacteraceae bacterium]